MRIPFLFWNLDKRPLQESVANLAAAHDLCIVILAECDIEPETMITEFSAKGMSGFQYADTPGSAGSDIRIFTRLPKVELRPVLDDPNKHLTLRRMVFSHVPDLLLVVVHLQSKINWSEDDQTHGAFELSKTILEQENFFSHRRTLLVGDLNMNPFEKGIVGSSGLHAVMTKGIAKNESRMIDARQHFFFYNPMWRFFGERSDGPPGTHYYSASGRPVSFFWNIYDQVMVRPALMNALDEVRILDRIGNVALLDEDGFPDDKVGSDHLPLLFTLNLLNGSGNG